MKQSRAMPAPDRPPPRPMLSASLWVWLGLIGLLGAVNLFITIIGAGLEADPRAALFSWPVIAVIGAAGLLGSWLASRTGFPAAWDARISPRRRLLLPTVIGLGLGVVYVVLEQFVHSIPLFLAQTKLPAFNAPLPGSVLFYAGGAVIVEVVYRLLPIPLLMWLISSLLLRGRGQQPTFWVLALLTSALEPVSQDLVIVQTGAVLMGAALFSTTYALNLIQAVFFRQAGLLAAILVRLAFYAVWHILYGNLICRC